MQIFAHIWLQTFTKNLVAKSTIATCTHLCVPKIMKLIISRTHMSANSEHIIHNLFLCNQKMVPHTQISSDAFESSLHDGTRTGDGASRRGWLRVILRPEAEEAKISSPIGTGAHGQLKGGMC